MKKLLHLAATALLVVAAANAAPSVQAQQRGGPAPSPRGPLLVQRVNPLDEVLQQLQDAESDSDKSEARARLRELLEEEYDRLMEAESQELEKLEQRLVDLREQLVRRRAAKEKMVDLRLETLVSEAEGFGWPGERSRGARSLAPRARLPYGQGLFSDVPFPEPPAIPAAPAAPPVRARGVR